MKRLGKNFLAITGSDIARRILGFFTTAYLARKTGTQGFGIITVGFAVLSYALMLSSCGLHTYGMRAVAKGEGRGAVNTVVSFRLVSSAVVYLFILAIGLLFVQPAALRGVMIVLSLSLFANAALLDWYFQGREDMGVIGMGRLVSAGVYLVLVFLLVHSAADLVWAASAAVAGDALAAGLLWSVHRRRTDAEKFHWATGAWRSALREAVPIGLGSALGYISINIPPLALALIMSVSDAGVYGAASKLVFFFLMLDRVLATLLLPASARFQAKDTELLATTLATALKWILLAALPVALGGSLLSEGIVGLVFGPQYALAAPVFAILIWFFLFTLLHTVYTSGLLALGREKEYSGVMMLSAVLYTVTVIAGTFLAGPRGAALAVVCSELGTLFLMRQRFTRLVQLKLPAGLPKIALATAAMGGVLLVLPAQHIVLLVVEGACAYALVLVLTGAVERSELSALLRRI